MTSCSPKGISSQSLVKITVVYDLDFHPPKNICFGVEVDTIGCRMHLAGGDWPNALGWGWLAKRIWLGVIGQTHLAGGDWPNAFGRVWLGFWKPRHSQPSAFGQSHSASNSGVQSLIGFLETPSLFSIAGYTAIKPRSEKMASGCDLVLVIPRICDWVSGNPVAFGSIKPLLQRWLIIIKYLKKNWGWGFVDFWNFRVWILFGR